MVLTDMTVFTYTILFKGRWITDSVRAVSKQTCAKRSSHGVVFLNHFGHIAFFYESTVDITRIIWGLFICIHINITYGNITE